MPSDANGSYSLVSSYFVQNGDTILPVQHNPVFEDIAAALTARLMSDGRTTMSGALKMGSQKVTGMANGEQDTDAAAIGQVVRIDDEQSLTTDEQEQATDNIGAVKKSGDTMSGALTVGGALTMGDAINMADNPLNRPFINDYAEKVNAIGAIGGGTQDIDLEQGNVVTATVDTAETTFTFSNPPATGRAGSFTLFLTNGGSQTVNWPASVDWPSGDAPTLTASGLDIITFVTIDAGTTWFGFPAGLGMA